MVLLSGQIRKFPKFKVHYTEKQCGLKKKTELLEKLSSVLLPHNGQWSCLNSKWGFHGHKGKFMDGCKKFPFAWILVCILRISSYLNELKVKKNRTHTDTNWRKVYIPKWYSYNFTEKIVSG